MTLTVHQISLLLNGLQVLADGIEAAPAVLYNRGGGKNLVRDARNLQVYIQDCLVHGDLTMEKETDK